jgi:glycogen operon protein
MQWHVFANTGTTPPTDSWAPGTEPMLENQYGLLMGDRSVAILVGK